jgi:hypothetical protein
MLRAFERQSERQRGITLIEVTIIIGLMGMLAAIFVLQSPTCRANCCGAAARVDLQSAGTAAQGWNGESPVGAGRSAGAGHARRTCTTSGGTAATSGFIAAPGSPHGAAAPAPGPPR